MQPGDVARRRAKTDEGVVFNRHRPEVVGNVAVYFDEIARKPARQIDQVRALVKKLAAAGQARISPPLALVPRTTSMSVPAADVHQIAYLTVNKQTMRLLQREVESVVEAYLDDDIVEMSSLYQRPEFVGIPRAWFF